MRTHHLISATLLIGATLSLTMRDEVPEVKEFTVEFNLDRTTIFLPSSDTLYCPLKPGTYSRFEGWKDGEFIAVERTVLNRINPIHYLDERQGKGKMAFARVVEEREWVDGELTEISYNFMAACPRTGNIYNFGEKVSLFENGRVVGSGGTWLVGKDGAQPGLLMPEVFLIGARYSHGIAPGISEDRAEHLEMGLTITTPAGTFENCVKVVETSPLEPDEESIIIYAPEVGIVADETLILVEHSVVEDITPRIRRAR